MLAPNEDDGKRHFVSYAECMTSTPSLLQQVHEFFMESQYWPQQKLAEYQRSQLGQLIHHAYEHSPFYKDRLKVLFNKQGEIDWQRWFEVPILTREELRDNYDELAAKVVPPGHLPTAVHRTSGTSGVPVRVITTSALATANRAAHLRSLQNLGIDFYSTAASFSRTDDGKPMTATHISRQVNTAWIMGEQQAKYYTINQMLPPQQQLKLMAVLGARKMYETTNRAALLAEVNLTSPNPLKLDMIQCYGQRITPEQHDLLARSFGAEITVIYSSTEAGLMACQCSSGNLHLNAETSLIELLGENNQPCPAGTRGRVIVTPFLASALPLIRYDQGDTAIEKPPCRCGITLPVIGGIEGKQHQLLMLPNGTFQLGSLFLARLQVETFSLAMQIAQVGPDAIEFRYVPKPDAGRAWQPRIRKEFRDGYYDKLKLSFKAMPQLPLTASGKQQAIVREWSPS